MCAEREGDEEAKGSRSAWLEQQYRERMEAILEGMQDGPLFQVKLLSANRYLWFGTMLTRQMGFSCQNTLRPTHHCSRLCHSVSGSPYMLLGLLLLF